jgi:predicted secreted Zn-dependent protease
MTKHKLLFAVIIFILAALALSGAAYAEPHVKIKYNYYEIQGTTAKELRQEMNLSGPLDKGEKRYDAETKWHVRWQYWFGKNRYECWINRVTTEVEVIFTFPKWKRSKKISGDLEQQWLNYMKALQEHENGHKEFGINAAKEIEGRLMSLRPLRSCNALENMANSIANQIIDKYIKIQIEYDRRTDHGRTQGAVFP